LDSRFGRHRLGGIRPDVRLHGYLRLHLIQLKGCAVFLTYLAAVVTVLLFVYLFAALLRPEWF
jgi:K+-transporting ATPase KdpF subunit